MFRYKRVLALQNYSMRGEIISMARIRVTEVVVPKIKPFILVCFQILRKVVFRIQKEMLNLVFELQTTRVYTKATELRRRFVNLSAHSKMQLWCHIFKQ